MLRRNRVATALVFAINGVGGGAWAGRIPDVKSELGLGSAQLGLCLLFAAVGSLAGMQVVSPALRRWGTARVTGVTVVVLSLSLVPLPLAGGPVALAVGLTFFGACFGFCDVAMNSHAVWVEQGYERPIMSSFHGWFSLGALVGAAAAGLSAAVDLSPTWSIVGTSLVLAVTSLVVARSLSGGPQRVVSEQVAADVPAVRMDRRVLLLGIFAFICLVNEGAVADWSGVLLREDRGAAAGLATTGYIAFNLCMTLGRFAGDRVTAAWGPSATLRRGAGVGSLALLAGLALPGALPAVVGFALLGIGLSVTVPLLFSAAGAMPGPTGTAIARVSTFGYFGFLVGPPTIGGLASGVGLPWALGGAVALLLLVAVAAPRVVPTRTTAVAEPLPTAV